MLVLFSLPTVTNAMEVLPLLQFGWENLNDLSQWRKTQLRCRRPLRVGSLCRLRRRGLRQRELHLKSRVFRFRIDLDSPCAALDCLAFETFAFAHSLGGEKRLEDVRLDFSRHARTVIADPSQRSLRSLLPERTHSRLRLLAIDDSVFHNKAYLFQRGDVLKRVAGDGNHIGEITRLERADLAIPTEEFSAIDQVRLQRGERRHSVFHHENKFPRLGSMGKWTDVGAEGHGHARSQLLAEFLCVEVQHLVLPLRLRRTGSMICEIFGNGKRGYGGDLFLAHHAHGFVTQLIGMVDGLNSRSRGIKGTRLTRGVHRNPLAHTRGLLYRSAQLGLGILKGSEPFSIA